MSSSLLTEYRCACGKLLFKGLLYQSIVEVKCRRCGEVITRGLDEEPTYAILESDTEANLVEVSGDVMGVLGSSREYFIGRPLFEVLPLLRDASEKESEHAYSLRDATLTLHDGSEQRIASCVVPKYLDGSFAGYKIFSRKA
ncbi:MAG TPA: hypothetical protein VJA87_00300 [Candidatus Paceibacterota bacterium]